MSKPLWDYQRLEVNALVARKRHALLWEPGCGKTAPLAVAGYRVGGRQLWVVPATLRWQVALEVRKFRPDGATCSIQIICTGKDIVGDATVVIVSYELARSLPIWKQLYKIRWGSLCLDEAHRLNNSAAVQTHAVYGARPDSKGALYRVADHVWISTGTIVTNHADGLYTHFSRLWPDLGPKTKDEWIKQFCVVEKDFFGERIVGSKNLAELRSMLAKIGSRKRLRDVRDVPLPLTDVMPIEGDALDLRGFDPETLQILKDALDEVESGADEWSLERALIAAPPLATLRLRIALAKAPTVASIVQQELDGGVDRILVFGCHVEALKLVAEKTGGSLIIGGVPQTRRAIAMDDFTTGKNPVLVGNIDALGIGLNLQAGARIIFLDAEWAPYRNEQAIARCYRAGQTRSVRASFVSLVGSIDERVQGVVERKASAIQQMQPGEETTC